MRNNFIFLLLFAVFSNLTPLVTWATPEALPGWTCSQFFSEGVHFSTHRNEFLYEQEMKNANPYFSPNYETATKRFRTDSRRLKLPNNKIEYGEYTDVPGAISEKVDYTLIHASDTPKNLVVIISGTHGAEGYAGSALQLKLLENLGKYDLSNTSVLLIHAFNPVGMKHMFRMDPVTMVNFNRGFPTNDTIFKPETNPDYSLIAPHVIPEGKYSHSWLDRSMGLLKSASTLAYFEYLNPIYRKLKKIKPERIDLRAAVGAGQYKFPNGNNFGGFAVHPNIRFFMNLITDLMDTYKFENQFVLDIHTGLGEVGKLSLLGEAVTPEGLMLQKKVLPGEDVIVYDPDDHDNYYPTFGGLTEWVQKVNPRTVPIVFEIGGGISTEGNLNGIIVGNILLQMLRACFYGCFKPEDVEAIQKLVSDWFNPSDRDWQDTVMNYYPVVDKLFENLPQ